MTRRDAFVSFALFAELAASARAADADVVLHDAQYLEEEYEASKIGWGHSSVDDAVAFSRAVGARQLVLFHHEPQRSDRALELVEARAREVSGPADTPPVVAREGMVFELA